MAVTQNAAVFRAYDIRGLVDKDFNVEWVKELGKACGTYFINHDIRTAVVGRDCRLSSPAYHDAVIAGLLSTGVDVISVGQVASPVFYFAVTHLNLSGGIILSSRPVEPVVPVRFLHPLCPRIRTAQKQLPTPRQARKKLFCLGPRQIAVVRFRLKFFHQIQHLVGG